MIAQTDTSNRELQGLLALELQQVRQTACNATVRVSAQWVDVIYSHACAQQQKSVQALGFAQGTVPLNYIETNFKSALLTHVQEFLLNYCVISFLYKELLTRKVLFSGDPRLVDISVQPHHHAHFTFELNTFPPIEIQDWKYLPFKSPKRKNYKDLDRQVESFIKEEKDFLKNCGELLIKADDWVNFTITLVDEHDNHLLQDHTENVWLKLGDEDADSDLSLLFIDKKVGDIFNSNNKALQSYFSEFMATDYRFIIHIVDVQPHSFFCFDQFKQCFKLKTNKEMNKKLIEVFSYRNDMSQRRTMAEESLKLLLSKNHFVVPNHLSLRQQARILDVIQLNPDYHVYRTQKDFKKRIRQLAEKQTKECLFLDQMAYHENISVTNDDIKYYLNLIKRPRTKDFIYFDPIITKIKGQEIPISSEELRLICLREKTLNYIIHHLTKE